MVGLWDWFKARGHANAKPVAGDEASEAPSPPRRATRRNTDAALVRAEDDWEKNGDRADQDYYHVPGGGNPDRKDPPNLNGEPFPKPHKRPYAHARSS